MPQQVLDEATGTVHTFPDDATPAMMQEAMAGYVDPAKPTLRDKLLNGGERALGDVAAVGTGVLKAGQGTLGLAGDLLNAAGLRSPDSILPTSDTVGKAFGTVSSAMGGPTELPKPETPEAKYIQAGSQGAAGMMTGNPWQALVGALSGVTGEAADQFAGKGGDGSMRLMGEAAGMLPVLLGLKAAPGVRSMQGALGRLGDTPAAVAGAIDRGATRAGVAADVLSMPHTSLWSQLPEIAPEVKALRGTDMGSSLNRQATDEAAAIAREVPGLSAKPGGKLAKVWDPTQGWIDPQEAIGNMKMQGLATTPDASTSLLSQSGNSLVGQVAGLLNPFHWPEKGGRALASWRGNVGLKGIAEALSSPDAAAHLKEIAGYNGGSNAARLIARSLLSMTVGMPSSSPEKLSDY